MFKLVENAYMAVLEKERAERMELEKSRQINQQLKEKLMLLESERDDLREKFRQNEVIIVDKKNELNNLLEELQKERRANLEQSQRLQICREQIESINQFIKELKPIKEQLDFKSNVTECLHELLVKTKLRIAESDDLLQELHDHYTALEYDVEKSKDIYYKGINQWQDEFLAARLREADVNLEFDKLKRDIATIKYDLEERRLIREATEQMQGKTSKTNRDSLRKKDKTHEMIIDEDERLTGIILDSLNEIDHLKHQLKKLEDQKDDCEKKIKSNEEIKQQLREVRRSIWLREFENNQKIENLREKYQKLSDQMTKELSKIQENIEEKDLAIGRIEEKIKNLEILNDSMETNMMTDNLTEDAAEKLEEERNSLENEIERLKKS
ncbi:structural maintenance of chromosomes protein 3-like isoform X2 [Sitophilus oryzae]|uniref:Structural maintenance of chromosomes protein 3-like isoform X2 n=1 Tax=Sitophilus oryzae TaxID=7048 RepID=A0A6J2X6H0_SITOR|nr:structural maintenance of chromosomes protein 3-like isoform X2 [Sitophilus oryzae]